MLLGLTCERDGIPDSCTNVCATTVVGQLLWMKEYLLNHVSIFILQVTLSMLKHLPT